MYADTTQYLGLVASGSMNPTARGSMPSEPAIS